MQECAEVDRHSPSDQIDEHVTQVALINANGELVGKISDGRRRRRAEDEVRQLARLETSVSREVTDLLPLSPEPCELRVCKDRVQYHDAFDRPGQWRRTPEPAVRLAYRRVQRFS